MNPATPSPATSGRSDLDAALEPWSLFSRWLEEATETEPRVPEAMQLATVGEAGPSLRTVLLKQHGPDGLVFYTNLGSRKARDLAIEPRTAFLLHFKGLERQIVGEGPVTPLDGATADAYWASRPRGSQLGAWASAQSQPISDPSELGAKVAEVSNRFANGQIPRPPFWGGFRLRPVRIEFWQGEPDRLHKRLVFRPTSLGWSRAWLQP